MSARICSANCSGLLAIGVAPCVAKNSLISGELTTLASSPFIRSTDLPRHSGRADDSAVERQIECR